MRKRDYLGPERRKYIRLDSVFPVNFQLLSLDGRQILSEWIQGFTNNISRGGICLAINQLDHNLAEILKNGQIQVSLKIEIPLNRTPVVALAKVSWIKDPIAPPHKYFIGLNYEHINLHQNNMIMRYAWVRKLFIPVALGIIFVVGLGLSLNSYINIKLIRGNIALVEQLVKIAQESSVAKQKIKVIAKEKEDLQLEIQTLQLQIQNAEEERENLKMKAEGTGAWIVKKIEKLNALIEKLSKARAFSQERLIAIQYRENVITEGLLRLDEAKMYIEKANFDKMYLWLKGRQNPRTGLSAGFNDGANADWALLYEQSLIALAYTNFGDFVRVRKILGFFDKKAQKKNGLFLNAYYASDGSPAETMVNSTPNIWLGIAALQYAKKGKDYKYLHLAEEIAETLINLQAQGKEEGIRGNLDEAWNLIEQNLDAYAFFNMLYKITANPVYQEARDRALDWLREYPYEKTNFSIIPWEGNSGIAIAMHTWSIPVLGPEKLLGLGINPDRVMDFAEQGYSVDAPFTRAQEKAQTIKIKGFNFTPQGRFIKGGVVFSEDSSRMVLAYKIMSDFYYKKGMIAKARSYKSKANDYLAELSNMVVSGLLPSGEEESYIPYATENIVDTGTGRMVLKGRLKPSLSGTAFALFAYYNYNPLELKE